MNKIKIILMMIAVVVAIGGCSLLTDENVAEGRKNFLYFCSSCHGEKGMGDGFNAVNVDPQPRDLTDQEEAYMAKLKNEDLFKVISSGGKAIDKSARMPPYGNTLSEKEIWEIIAFVRTLHSYKDETINFEEGAFDTKRPRTKVKKIGSDRFENIKKREARKGKSVFKRNGCSACHKIGDKGGDVGPDLTNVGRRLNGPWTYRFLRAPQSVIKEVKMPNYGLNEKKALSLTYYLLSLK